MKKSFIIILLLPFLLTNCKNNVPDDVDFKQEMRNFVQGISKYSKNINSNFIIIPQNGEQLATENGEHNGVTATDYLNAIDGQGREDLFYGYDNDDKETSQDDINATKPFLQIEEENNVEVLVTDYCSTHSKIDNSYIQNNALGMISFSAPDRGLSIIPSYPEHPYNENSNNIKNLTNAKNFLYLINPDMFTRKSDFIYAISQTNYDVVLMDFFFYDAEFTQAEITALKTKQNGGSRLVISYISIGEAEDYRYYWEEDWKDNKPSWLDKENPNWEGNYKVWYWNKDWQKIIYGNDDSYIKKILDVGFDGVYLDIIDAFEYYEK